MVFVQSLFVYCLTTNYILNDLFKFGNLKNLKDIFFLKSLTTCSSKLNHFLNKVSLTNFNNFLINYRFLWKEEASHDVRQKPDNIIVLKANDKTKTKLKYQNICKFHRFIKKNLQVNF